MSKEDYNTLFFDCMRKHSIEFLKSPSNTIELWKEFVDEISEDYDFIHVEFEHDLQNIRPQIELLLSDKALNRQNEHKRFISSIKELDDEFIVLTMENPAWKQLERRYWFENRVLKKAGPNYARFINDHFEKSHGIKVEIEKK